MAAPQAAQAAPTPSTPSILEDYAEGSAELPGRLHAAFETIRTLDEEDAALLSGIEELVSSRLGALPAGGGGVTAGEGLSPGRRARAVAHSEDAQRVEGQAATLAAHGNTKCALANECYDSVDALIVRLDKDLACLDAELLRVSAEAASLAPQPTEQQHPRERHEKRKHAPALLLPPGALPASAAALRADQPVDPNEPTYCTCARVSFGDMIACESETCPVEWFHYECVGLPPGQELKAKWYCPGCSASLKVKIKKK